MSSPIGSTVVKLNNGISIPALGLGTWKSRPGEVKAAVEAAIDAGYRHIDCAAVYGNEKEVGDALTSKMNQGIKREEIFITSKLWNTKHAKDDVRPALMKTLKDLQLSYLDLYLIHWPTGFQAGDSNMPKDADGKVLYSDVHYNETWAEVEKAVDDGLVKSIGLSNFNSKQIDDVCNVARIKPAVLQCESHPYLIQKELINHAKNHGIVFTAYSPLGSPDRPWAKPGEPSLLEDPNLLEVGKKFNKSPAQICIKWQIQRGNTVVPKSVTPSRIVENADLFDFELSEDDMKVVESFHRNWRACLPKVTVDGKDVPRDESHPFYPFGLPY